MKEYSKLTTITGKITDQKIHFPRPCSTPSEINDQDIDKTTVTLTLEMDGYLRSKQLRFTASGLSARLIAPYIMNEKLQLNDLVRIEYDPRARTMNTDRVITTIGWSNCSGIKIIKN